jgi:hypothetical protein
MATITLDKVEGIIAATQKAVLVRFKNQEETWIPRSVCDDGSELEIGDTDIVVQTWFAEKEGLD